MNYISPVQFERLLPLACEWAEEQEGLILEKGIPLSSSQIEDAIKIGVTNQEQVRLLKVEKVPLPENSELRVAAELTQLLSTNTIGITFRYGIFIRYNYWGDRQLIVHELVHTKQYEQLGGFQPFLKQYLTECLTIGYPKNPMEQEAIRITREICGK